VRFGTETAEKGIGIGECSDEYSEGRERSERGGEVGGVLICNCGGK
jgi:hypothetical protein